MTVPEVFREDEAALRAMVWLARRCSLPGWTGLDTAMLRQVQAHPRQGQRSAPAAPAEPSGGRAGAGPGPGLGPGLTPQCCRAPQQRRRSRGGAGGAGAGRERGWAGPGR